MGLELFKCGPYIRPNRLDQTSNSKCVYLTYYYSYNGVMGWELFDGFKFDLGHIVQDFLYHLLLVPEVCDARPTDVIFVALGCSIRP